MLDEDTKIDEKCLQARLQELKEALPSSATLIGELESFVREASDRDIVRINPVKYATNHGRDFSKVLDLFLYARRAGLLIMDWQYVCHVCGMIVESFHELNSAGEHFFCNMCIADRDADLSDYVEITFTVSRAVRLSRFHTPSDLDAKNFMINYITSASAIAMDGSNLRDFYWNHTLVFDFVEPAETKIFEIELNPGFVALTHGPELRVSPQAEESLNTLHVTQYEGRLAEKIRHVKPGPLTYSLTNDTSSKLATSILYFTPEDLKSIQGKEHGVKLGNFLSGAQLLSTQTFLDLFPSETVMSAGGLAVKRMTFVFTDLKGSTALYDQIGDMKAFNLVRQHFAVLRDVIAKNNGAMVKTIGDAVMASFHDPLDAVNAALEMSTEIERFNNAAGEELILLKIGAHTGHCLAVTLNDRLDYFGQTVNLAARVQGLADGGEICLTEDLFSRPGIGETLNNLSTRSNLESIKGIEAPVTIHTFTTNRNRE